MEKIAIRPAGADDLRFLEDMLVEAANTPSHPGRSRAETLAEPEVAHYLAGWPRATDLGVVAERSGRAVGAAWLRYFDETAPAYGFVAPDVPELAIGVDAASRGGGVGRMLLRELVEVAKARGIARISLSVERANPAARLYAAEGFAVVQHRDNADTMVRSL
ncbi:GNAT family N-acetyltransferase [Saccharopolyspora sp. TS4A08]|uniref:GNAT family N-acetyltransferase n=1 Tax=Saccharopolyspora ipomoeae TaxID=3042027 RepID=A0ABT6PI22_9PSEU|nr:GNAT family N-acetyltransferase [Saccharopolyspora sp. TS4A08]MDI2027646.1 GNAT family N-acetyltransferase [Saccharopolyspora sp. TS4A08]